MAAIEQLDAPPRPVADRSPVVAPRARHAPRIALGAGAVALLAGVLAITLRSRDDRSPQGSTTEVVRADTPALKQAAGGDIARPAASPGGDASAADPVSARVAPDTSRVVAQTVPRSTPAASIRPGDTTGTGSPRERAADPASASRAALDSIDKLLSGQSSPTAEQATQILETLRRIRPDLTRADDLRAQLYAAEALLVFGQTADACKLLRAVDRDGAGTDVGRVAHRYLNPPPDSSGVLRLKCPE